jgi:hypothetical protein
VPVIITICVILLLTYGAGKYTGIFKNQPEVVGKNDSCYRPTGLGGSYKLPVGVDTKPGDDCNNKIILATPTQTQIPTQMPTQTLLSTSVFTPEEMVVLPSVTPEPAEQSGKVIKVVLLDGSPAEQGWIEVPSLDGYHQVDDAKCGDVLEIPANTSFAFVLFEGGRDNWLISDSIANVSDTKIGIVGSSLVIDYCKVGSWFSLWIK